MLGSLELSVRRSCSRRPPRPVPPRCSPPCRGSPSWGCSPRRGGCCTAGTSPRPSRCRVRSPRPARVRGRQRARGSVLVDLAEAAVGGRARRQPELAAIGREVALGVGIVVGVDDRHRLARTEIRRQLVRGGESDGPYPPTVAAAFTPPGIVCSTPVVRRSAKHASSPGGGSAQTRAKDAGTGAGRPPAAAALPPKAAAASPHSASKMRTRDACETRPERRDRRDNPFSMVPSLWLPSTGTAAAKAPSCQTRVRISSDEMSRDGAWAVLGSNH